MYLQVHHFVTGTMFIFRLEAGQISITVVAASNLVNKTQGLMGVFDQNSDNDLKVRDGPTLSINSSYEVIYAEFGESCKCMPIHCVFSLIDKDTHARVHAFTHKHAN